MSISFIYPQYLWLLLLVPLTVILALLGRRGLTRRRFWSGLVLRSLLLFLIVFALAGIQLRLPSNLLTTIFVLDVSDSIPEVDQAAGESFIRQAVESMPLGDRAAVVVFGQDALVERLASGEQTLPGLASVPVTTRTDIASALQLALALFPDEGARRLVLLSDGRENINQALEQAELAAAQDVELQFVPLGQQSGDAEVLVESLQAPGDARQGQEIELSVAIASTVQTRATLRMFAGGDLVETRELDLQEGVNRLQIPVDAGEAGFRRFRVQVSPDVDHRLQNNQADAFTVVHGPPHILLVEGEPGEAENLARALEAAQMRVSSVAPAQLPNTLPELAAYDAVILANVSAPLLPTGVQEVLVEYVRTLGRGLLMTGGQESFGAGGYLRSPLEEALPVNMDVRSRELAANLALVLAVDKSGSMGACHCENPDLNQTYERREVGQPKVDIAKSAIMNAASALGDQDYLGVVAFDSQARWAYHVARLPDASTLENAIGVFGAEGQTNLRAGVEAAYASLQDVDAARKHIILMTDGWMHEGELLSLAEEMHAEGITLSVVAAGGGAAEYLEELSRLGGGRFYPAEDILSVPDIFLKETVTSVGEYLIEEPFYPVSMMPSPILRGLNELALPPLLGYNGATAKRTARLDLTSPRGDPLLATWQFGLGRAAAWTSDLKGQWASEWIAWEDFPRFAAQLVGWLLPAPQVEGLSARVEVVGGQAVIQLQAAAEDGAPLNFLTARLSLISPDLETSEADLEQVGPGSYEARIPLSQPGVYLVRLGVNQDDQSLGQLTLGMVLPYSPEYRLAGADVGLLSELARVTGGEQLLEPVNAFLHDLPAAEFAREIWRPLLLLAALLFPLDVALRRVLFGPRELQRARVWLRARLPGAAASRQDEPLLGDLFAARQRARRRHTPGGDPEQPAPPLNPPQPPTSGPAEPSEPPSASPPDPGDALARLRAAKKRAQKDER